jgi:predicted N-acetyltransferase YhbS
MRAMDAIETTTRAFTAADLDAGGRLVAQAGWNQVDEYWRCFIGHGAAWAVEAPDTGVIATAATLPYAGIAWISMVLVDAAWRRRGIARELIARCTRELDGAGLVPVLDATPAGRTVYAGMAFRDVLGLQRWARGAGARTPVRVDREQVRPLRSADLDAVAALDARAFGAPRAWLIASLAARSGRIAAVLERDGAVVGAVLGRPGRLATQIGPIVAPDEAGAIALLEHATAMAAAPVFLDALAHHGALADALERLGYAPQRPFSRMAWRRDALPGDPARYFAAAGPELG